MAERVLNLLREQGDWCSGEGIGGELAISRSAVSKHIAVLRRRGYEIESAPRRGYRLASVPGVPCAAEVGPLLTTEHFGRALHHVDMLDSTNNRAAEDAKCGAAEGTVWVCEQQTAGRGRMQRSWYSPVGSSLYASMILRPTIPLTRIAQLALVVAVAIERALLTRWPELQVKIKWPNDILVGRRKLCGVLCESEVEADAVHHAVVGFGINVNTASFPAELEHTATSLCRELGAPVSRAEVLAAVLNAFEPVYRQWLEADDLLPFLPFLEQHSLLQARAVTVVIAGRETRGTVCGVSRSGELMLDCEGKSFAVTSGDVQVRGW